VKRRGGNKSWDYMFVSWKCYAEEFPEKKNNVCIETHGRLNNWVKEQRRKFVKNILTDQRFQLLRSEGFDFAPRKGTGVLCREPVTVSATTAMDYRTELDRKFPAKHEPNEMINASVNIPLEACRDVPSAKPPSEVIGVTPRPLSEAKGIFDLPSNTVSSGRKDDDIPVSSTVATVEVVGSEPNEAINASVNNPAEDCRDIPLVDDSVTVSQSIQPIGDTFEGKCKKLPKKAKAVVPLQNEHILPSASVKENPPPKKPALIEISKRSLLLMWIKLITHHHQVMLKKHCSNFPLVYQLRISCNYFCLLHTIMKHMTSSVLLSCLWMRKGLTTHCYMWT